ncbi:hypothetical protein ZIOFF_038168 [Zingiber officinale]|uniref:Large ribosomal subunit protein bL28m n=2 Tax=Zingiber officinale TaxID=94328 RepID=A0A8J5GCH0_ZINOF|nr:hypothetical protein ZIOFF_038168 [Zingiber officinale]
MGKGLGLLLLRKKAREKFILVLNILYSILWPQKSGSIEIPRPVQLKALIIPSLPLSPILLIRIRTHHRGAAGPRRCRASCFVPFLPSSPLRLLASRLPPISQRRSRPLAIRSSYGVCCLNCPQVNHLSKRPLSSRPQFYLVLWMHLNAAMFLGQTILHCCLGDVMELGAIMAFRSREIYNKVARKVGDKMAPEVLESMKKLIPNSKVVMERAKRGIFAGRHIQFGNKVSEDGGNKSRRTWKPNVQEKRLFSYIHDRHIRVKVTTHALRCIDKAGGIDEYLLNTPYRKMDTELGLAWKAKIEKMYAELGQMEVGFFPPEEEAKIEKGFAEEDAAKKEARMEARKARAKQRQINSGIVGDQTTNVQELGDGASEDTAHVEDGISQQTESVK